MYRTTVVQNKIISIICSCLFFCLTNIYRPSLGKVWLGRSNPNHCTQFLSQKEKKNILLRIVCTTISPRLRFSIFQFRAHIAFCLQMWCPINSETGWCLKKYFFARMISKLVQFIPFASINIPSKRALNNWCKFFTLLLHLYT